MLTKILNIHQLPYYKQKSASVSGPFHVDSISVAQLDRLTDERGVHTIRLAKLDESIVELGRSTGPVVTTHDSHVDHFTEL